MTETGQPTINQGIFLTKEIAKILRLPPRQINSLFRKYSQLSLGKDFSTKYFWKIGNSKAVDFHTLIELYIIARFSEAGVKAKNILTAHKELGKIFDTSYPFAQKNILESIYTDGKTIFLSIEGHILSLDSSLQLNMHFIHDFFQKLDFGADLLAKRYYPLGKEKQIVVDPKRQFGHPVIDNTNIYPETVFNMFQAGESVKFIASIYNLSEEAIKDAIEYCTAA